LTRPMETGMEMARRRLMIATTTIISISVNAEEL